MPRGSRHTQVRALGEPAGGQAELRNKEAVELVTGEQAAKQADQEIAGRWLDKGRQRIDQPAGKLPAALKLADCFSRWETPKRAVEMVISLSEKQKHMNVTQPRAGAGGAQPELVVRSRRR